MAATRTRSASSTSPRRAKSASAPKSRSRSASPRKKKSADGGIPLWIRWGSQGLLLAAALMAGYLLRSYAPLPLPGDPRLSGGHSFASDPPMVSSAVESTARDSMRRAEQAEGEVQRLKSELYQVQERQERTEAELADIQLKALLSD